MALLPVCCPSCQREQVSKGSKTDTGTQRYRGHTPDCPPQSFLLDSASKGRAPQLTQQESELRRKGSGVRDTACVLGSSPTRSVAKF
jgi:insertion element IS1 protein InsB